MESLLAWFDWGQPFVIETSVFICQATFIAIINSQNHHQMSILFLNKTTRSELEASVGLSYGVFFPWGKLRVI